MESRQIWKVSIIIPCFNPSFEDLHQAIKSAIEQTVPPFEVIIVNDGSEDVFGFEALACFDTPFLRRVDIAHSGLGLARNQGIGVSKGDYIVFMDCDDIISPSFVETISQHAADHLDVMVFGIGDHASISAPQETMEVFSDSEASRYLNRIIRGYKRAEVRSVCGKAFFRAFLLEKGLSFENVAQGEDQLFMYDVSFHNPRLGSLPSFCSYQYNWKQSSMSNSFDEAKIASFLDLMKRLRERLVKRGCLSKQSPKAREYFYTVSGEYIPRLLKIVFCNKGNPKSFWRRYKEARSLFFKDPLFLECIRFCKIADALSVGKRIQLLLTKFHILLPLFLHYS